MRSYAETSNAAVDDEDEVAVVVTRRVLADARNARLDSTSEGMFDEPCSRCDTNRAISGAEGEHWRSDEIRCAMTSAGWPARCMRSYAETSNAAVDDEDEVAVVVTRRVLADARNARLDSTSEGMFDEPCSR